MRFLSIAALSGLLAITVNAHAIDFRTSNLEERGDNCGPGTEPANGGCRICFVGYYNPIGTLNTACQACPAGTFASARGAMSCAQCAANTFSASGASSCTACPSGWSSLPGSSQCLSPCTAGKYWSGSQCSTCPAGRYSAAGATSCSSCPQDTYSSAGAGSCTQCPAGKGSPSGSTSVSQCVDKCSSGQIYSNGSCQTCTSGTYSSNNVCASCPPGFISISGSTTCTACPGGSVPGPSGQTCKSCSSNTFSNGNNCSPCPAGTTSNPGSTSCGPQSSKRAQPIARRETCASGWKSCPVLSGRGGSECINPMITLDSCGGCVAVEGDGGPEYTGRDCSAIANVGQVKCNWGRCEIKSCRPGYQRSGDSCIPKTGSGGKNDTLHTRGTYGRFARHHSL